MEGVLPTSIRSLHSLNPKSDLHHASNLKVPKEGDQNSDLPPSQQYDSDHGNPKQMTYIGGLTTMESGVGFRQAYEIEKDGECTRHITDWDDPALSDGEMQRVRSHCCKVFENILTEF